MPPPFYVTNACEEKLAARLYLWKPRADARAGSAARREDGMPPLLCVTNACGWNLAARLRIPQTAR